MDNRTDVKAIMARFQQSEVSTKETDSTPPGPPKKAVHPTLSSGPTIPTKKPVRESLSGTPSTNVPRKPSFLTNTAKRDTEAIELNITKALESRFANAQDDASTTSKPFIVNKQQIPFKPPLSQTLAAKGPGQMPPLNKPSLCSTLSDPKPTFPKPCPIVPKPCRVEAEDSGGAPGSTAPKRPPLQHKPSRSSFKLREQNDKMAGDSTDTMNKPLPPANSTFKPTTNFKATQNMFNRVDKTEESESGLTANGVKKMPLNATNSIPPPRPPASKKPSTRSPPKFFPQVSSVNHEATSCPRRKPLPSILAVGPAPAKPNRPPKVNLDNFKRGAEASDNVSGILKKPNIPTPPVSHSGNRSNHMPPTPPPPALPSLPPRHPVAMMQQDEFYDDVDEFSRPPPPLPPFTGHPSQRAKEENDDDEGELYEDLDDRWEAAEQIQEEKDDREEKKWLEAEKKEQREREKKEQGARKKYKLVGPLEAINQGKARSDYKGSKTDLALKQGECLDIIRVQGNPEGKWLGRTQDGSIGYVKITLVEIDFNTLKNRKAQPEYVPEEHDDVDVASLDKSGTKGPRVVLPLPPEEGGEIYDDIVDPNLEVSPLDPKSSPKPRGLLRMFDRSRRTASLKVLPPPRQSTAEGNSDTPGAASDEEIYDDIDTHDFPPPPPLSSLPTFMDKSKTEELDPKKQKKIEKEEKEFRKKFKYEGEIQVLYQVTVVSTLTSKKWTGRELPLKAGERLDVIVKAVDNKLVCQNEEGKFGYVSTSHIVMDDDDIYDDIGDDCIYDND